jgi:hypothetical protein
MSKEHEMIETVSTQAIVAPDHTLLLTLPSSIPVGPVKVVVVIAPVTPNPEANGTAAELASSPLFGLWRDRQDLPDSITYARQLRAQVERRNND